MRRRSRRRRDDLPMFERLRGSEWGLRESAPDLESLLALAPDQLFEEASIDRDEIGDDAYQPNQGADDYQNYRQDQRLDMSGWRASEEVKNEETHQERAAQTNRNRSEKQEDPQWTV